jgi:hypothetical protein
MAGAFDPKLNRGTFIMDDWDDYSSAVAPQPAERDKYRAMAARMKLMRDPGELAMVQPDAREKLRWALRMALALPERAGRKVGEIWELRPEINPPKQRLDKYGEPATYRVRKEGRLRTPPITTPNGISDPTRQHLINLGLQETDPFPTKTTLRKVLAVYKAKPVVTSIARGEAMRIIEDAIEWERPIRTRRQIEMEQMRQDLEGPTSHFLGSALDGRKRERKTKKDRNKT